MLGHSFLVKLQKSLFPNQLIGDNYHFDKWMPNGGLQFKINNTQRKTIPAEILMLAYHIHLRNNRVNTPTLLNQRWLRSNGHTEWCFIEVINWLLQNNDHD
jgi:hypothetical protein